LLTYQTRKLIEENFGAGRNIADLDVERCESAMMQDRSIGYVETETHKLKTSRIEKILRMACKGLNNNNAYHLQLGGKDKAYWKTLN